MRNYIKMNSNYIELNGFNNLSDEITFCFYASGVVITEKKQKERKYYYQTKIDNERKINDKNLINTLSNKRNYIGEIDFFYTGDSYMEVEPRSENEES